MNVIRAEEFSSISIGSCGDGSSSFDATFSFDGIETVEVEGDVFEHGQIMSGWVGPGTHLVVLDLALRMRIP